MTISSLLPNPSDPRLSRQVTGIDETGQAKSISVIEERPLTIYLNSQEIVTAMTIGDYPEYLALGFLLNQGMLKDTDQVTRIDFDEELEVAVVRTAGTTDVEDKLQKKTRTSGCAVGTVFGDMMAGLDGLSLPDTPVHTSTFYDLSFKINHTPSLYMETGAIHGTALCHGQQVLAYMEDVGRHNAVDKIAGWMHLNDIPAADKVLYTTGRLTSEMVIKTALMGIPTLISRSGFTAWGVDIAQQVGLTLIGRMRGKKFTCLSGQHRLVFDQDLSQVPDDDKKMRRKGARDDG
ncbi:MULTISPECIES: formate dehydrogenase accessory sulfurtransferase FdhD [Marinobacter]|uniref:Sulfur carrier protein FdhD n=1 Tax=Marinobacter suaedae TaxID=3057675 RepID=A0ABT8W092_9GAMM|nr:MULTISPECIES: formate dehydrogenase accessory sulfurtransferase FdhD [unclassified Marinobacter]MBZ2169817.1 formate dehydrogenase accessory sulfurtransferase FdhD [Marinobacter sp. F4216]MDO3721641.1 formate dehydrogenase accessory sulfurtransferase FdhD [Marinobacter sp. chi1]